MDPLKSTLSVLASGMKSQSERLKVISQNLANKDSTALRAEDEPYRRKIVHFQNYFDEATQTELVHVSNISEDQRPFERRFDPNHPGADAKGYIRQSNVIGLIEVTDMQQANRSYQAQLNSFRLTRQLQQQTINMLQ